MYIPIRDETTFMIKYYQYFFNKYWDKDMNVYFLGYKVPDIKLDDNIHFVSLAEKRDPIATAWSNKIVEYMESIDDKYFYFSLEDLLVIRPVDHELLRSCEEIMAPNIGRIDLWNSIQFDPNRRNWVSFYKEHKGVRFLALDWDSPQSAYRVSCSNSIWNRKWFLKTLERGYSPSDWETKANDGRNNNDGYEVLSTINRWTPSVVHALSRVYGKSRITLQGVLEEDLENLNEISTDEEKELFMYESFPSDGCSVINLLGFQPNDQQLLSPNIV